MSLESMGRAIKKELFKEVPDSSAFVEEIRNEGNKVDHVKFFVELKIKGRTSKTPGNGICYLRGEVFDSSNKKIAGFQEEIGRASFTVSEYGAEVNDLEERAERKIGEIKAQIKEGPAVPVTDEKITVDTNMYDPDISDWQTEKTPPPQFPGHRS